MLLGLNSTVCFFAGQGPGEGGVSRMAVGQRLVRKTNRPPNHHANEVFQYKHGLNPKVLEGLSCWVLGLGGELEGVSEEIWGPQNEAPPRPTMDPIPHDDPQMAVTLQHKSLLKTFITK